jgi:hypothetical protein
MAAEIRNQNEAENTTNGIFTLTDQKNRIVHPPETCSDTI